MAIRQNYSDFLVGFNSDKFKRLWPAQEYVLNKYSDTFTDTSDTAIELPTGGGKTLISLLIAEAWRQDGKKVAILSANKTLARQMSQESQSLKINTILMEGRGVDIPVKDRRAYQRAANVAIMNYWVYFNQNPVIDPADLIIMDDAHLAEHCLHSLYSVEIDRFGHETLFKTLATELYQRFPEYTILPDLITGDAPPTCPPEMLSFIDQTEISRRFREIIDSSPYIDTDDDLKFRWNRMRDHLNEANIYIGLNSIWIRPYIYPLISNAHYEQTMQRLYMSATVGDPADLSRRLGVKNIVKIPVPPEFAEKTFGRRLIVMNRIEDKDLPDRLQAAILASLRIHPKSLWLCSSKADAIKYKDKVSEWLNDNGLVGHPTWVLTPLGDEIDQFKQAPQGHLFVAGRFDGMDFTTNECKLVIITTVPNAINLQEEFISAYLRDSGFMRRRLNQRIIQALGRCNRSDNDYGIYVLADRRFATHFGRESNRAGIPRNIIAEIDLAQDSSEIRQEELVHQIETFLRKDFNQYDADVTRYLAEVPVPPAQPQLQDTSSDEVIGWSALFQSKNYQIAADRFEACWEIAKTNNLIEIGALHGWHWAKSLYLQSLLNDPASRDKSLTTLEAAITRGGQSAWFNRMRASLNRARNVPIEEQQRGVNDYSFAILTVFDDLIEKLGNSGTRFDRWCRSLSDKLQSQNHSQYQEGLEVLGNALGYHATRPRYNTATDCRWRGIFGNTKEVVTFEAKIEDIPSNKIIASDIGQAHNQYTRAYTEYDPQGYIVKGSIVTHLTDIAPEAQSSIGTLKIIEKSAINALWDRTKLLLSLYRAGWSLDNLQARLAAAQAISPKLPSSGWLTRAFTGDGLVINTEHLMAEWPKDP